MSASRRHNGIGDAVMERLATALVAAEELILFGERCNGGGF
jgi:hypothetical protein